MNSVNYFNDIAEKWNDIRSEYFEEKLKHLVLSTVDIKNKICMDLGCGTGFISLELAKKAKLVFSLDNSKNMLQEIKKNIEQEKINNLYAMRGSIEEIPIFDNTVECVFINMALHHVKDVQKAINDMFRVLKNSGTIVISDVEEHSGSWAKEEMHDEWLGFSHSQIKEWLKQAGFLDIEIKSSGLRCKGCSSKGEYTETGIFIVKAIKR